MLTIYGPCGLTAGAAAVVRRIGEKRGQGILPHETTEGDLVWASAEEVTQGQVCRPTQYWVEDGHGGARYTSCTGNTEAHVDASGTVRGRTRSAEWRATHQWAGYTQPPEAGSETLALPRSAIGSMGFAPWAEANRQRAALAADYRAAVAAWSTTGWEPWTAGT